MPMRSLLPVLLLLLAEPRSGRIQVNFDHDDIGRIPPGWDVALTHQGAPPQWLVIRDPSAPSAPNVFAQLSRDQTAGRFPLAICKEAVYRDGEVSVAFRPVSGLVDQAAGIVWRYRDPGNYYIARVNALEGNVVLYKVQGGVRESIAPKGLPSRSYGVNYPIPTGRWGLLRVTFQGPVFVVYVNHAKVLEAVDTTFTTAGKTGLWTKADSVTYFDNYEVSGK